MSGSYTHYKMSAESAQNSKDYKEAEKMWQQALKEATTFGKDDGRYCLCVDNLAEALYHQDKFSEAEKLYRTALEIRESSTPDNVDDIASCLNNLATVQFKQDKFDEAEKNYNQSLKIREEQTPGGKSQDIAYLIYQIGMIYHKQKKFPQAEDFYKKALDMKNKVFGPNHVALIPILKNYANLLKKTGRESTANQMYQFAESIESKN